MSELGSVERRVIIVVLDGFGVGAMPDAAGPDEVSNTLRHVDDQVGPLTLPTLSALGLGNLTPSPSLPAVRDPKAAVGRCALAHPGADTYLGHQELMGGGLDRVEMKLLADLHEPVVAALEGAGHTVELLDPGISPLVVDGCVLVADNIEARPRLNINVTGSLDDVSFEDLTAIGMLVRAATPVSRVIVVASRGFGMTDIRHHVKERSPGQIGVDSPALGVYDDSYQVRHLGVEFDADEQLPARVLATGQHVALLGKAADVVRCPGAQLANLIDTKEVFAEVSRQLSDTDAGLIVANVQETDLAGHEEDSARYGRLLETIDQELTTLIDQLRPDDVLILTGDHGNDPTSGSSRHTREYTPCIVVGPSVRPVELGTRSSLADIAASAADMLGVERPGSGTSFAQEVLCS